MGTGLLIEYLHHSKTLLRAKTILKDLCGLDLFLLDTDRKAFVLFPRQVPSALDQINNKIHIEVPKTHWQELAKSKAAIDFVADGLTMIAVPLIYHKQFIGALLMSETRLFKLNRCQIDSLKIFLQETIVQVVEHDFKLLKDFSGNEMSHQKKTVYRVTQFINENYNQPELSLDQVSKKNNISYHYLSRLFKKELKTNFSSYLNGIRLDVASRLLKDRSLTVSQVSFSCGFEDPSYFSKVFKKHHGQSPVIFRDKMLTKRKTN
jgi:AraC-like DNA-binding protein